VWEPVEIKHLNSRHSSGFHKIWEGRMHSMYVPHVVCFLKTIIRTCGYRLIVVSLTIMCTSIFSFVSFSLDYSVKWYRSHVLIYFCPSLLFNCLSYTISCPPLPANLILGLALTIVSTSLIIWHTTPSLMYNHHTSFAHLLSSPPKFMVLCPSLSIDSGNIYI